uniref:VWFA domain-containing protein n=1 Tax=Periophthalmus magnuspinnatus TaxID=409849 RepID=A0A3B4B795_9GOBI
MHLAHPLIPLDEPINDCLYVYHAEKNECPIDVYFTIDTSETIALQEPPPGSLVESIKSFTEQFAQRLEDHEFKGVVRINWNLGGLHFSQRQEVFSRMASKSEFIAIRYLGKGTYIDCAIANMTQEMVRSPTYPKSLRFAVVITDGHVTGNPCGGIKVAAEKARDEGIRIFVVAASKNVDENGLKEIANSPAAVYRRDFMAVDLSQGRAIIHTETMDRRKRRLWAEGWTRRQGDSRRSSEYLSIKLHAKIINSFFIVCH